MRIDMPTFSGGEIGDDLLARDDVAKYRTALRRARNVHLAVGGGAYNRTGLVYVGATYNPNWEARLIPFQFSADQGYAIEVTPFVLRFVVNGGYVLRPELQVAGITNEFNAMITTVGPHGYVPGYDIIFSGIQGMTQINGMQGRVTDVDLTATTFRVTIDTRNFGAFTGAVGGVAGDALGHTGGEPPPPPVETPPTDPHTPPVMPPPREPPPPFQNQEPYPDVWSDYGDYPYY